MAYPGWFFGCPETPPAMIFLNQAVTPFLAPTSTSHLNLPLLETPPETNSGYATGLGSVDSTVTRTLTHCTGRGSRVFLFLPVTASLNV